MLPSLRHFFRFVDLDETFVAHGFYKKVLDSLIIREVEHCHKQSDKIIYVDWCSLYIEQQGPSL